MDAIEKKWIQEGKEHLLRTRTLAAIPSDELVSVIAKKKRMKTNQELAQRVVQQRSKLYSKRKSFKRYKVNFPSSKVAPDAIAEYYTDGEDDW